MWVWLVPLVVVVAGLAAAAAVVGRAAEEARRLGHAADRWAELRASWWPLRREAGELRARLARFGRASSEPPRSGGATRRRR